MKRIFIQDFTLKKLKLDSENLHYLTKTLRFRGEERLLVFDGEKEAQAIFNKDQTINILQVTRQKEKSFLKLAIAEIKKERLEWIVEKSTELGVNEIILLKTTRTQNFINIERINKIILSGCKQSSRISIPTLKQLSLNKFLKESVNSEWVYGSLQKENKKIPETVIGAIIGPEGGWTEDEEEMLEKSFLPIYLNDNILRAETAAITALNYIQYSKF